MSRPNGECSIENSESLVWNIASPEWRLRQRDGVPRGGCEGRRRGVVLLDRHRLSEGEREGAAHEGPRDLEALLTRVVPVHEQPEARAREPTGCGRFAQLLCSLNCVLVQL